MVRPKAVARLRAWRRHEGRRRVLLKGLVRCCWRLERASLQIEWNHPNERSCSGNGFKMYKAPHGEPCRVIVTATSKRQSPTKVKIAASGGVPKGLAGNSPAF